MAETPTTQKLLTLAGLTAALASVRNFLLNAAGKLKPSLIPFGSGLKEQDGKIVFDAENVEIDASKVNIATASASVKGLVQVGSGINVSPEGVISVDPVNLAPYSTTEQVNAIAEAKAKAAVDAIVADAPEALDTLKEIADYLTDNSVADGLVKQLAAKANASFASTDEITAALNDIFPAEA